MAGYKVLIRRCDDYDPDRIAAIVKEGMEELDVQPHGKVLLKPNTVLAHPDIFPYAFTRAEFLDGVLSATKALGQDIEKLGVGERSGISIPTRYCFKNAGYNEVIRRHGVKTYYFDESRQVPVALKEENRLRERLFVPKPVAECDFLINLPKFKAHPWTKLTLSLKNYIGIQDDRHRLLDHNSYLEYKIADLQEAIRSRFIAIDGIVAGQKMMLTPTPFPLGAIVMGTNSCAVDTVGCAMVGVEPESLVHLRLSSGRRFGPMKLEDIEVSGDYPLEEINEKTKDFEFCLEHIDDYFKEHEGIKCTVGTFPEGHSRDYCWGGCPGALQEAMHIFKGFNPEVDREMKKVHVVVGEVEGPLDLADDERVLFSGDCTSWEGEIDGKNVQIKSRYKSSVEMDEGRTRSNDMILKVLGCLWKCFKMGQRRYLRASGCTVSVAEHVNYVAFLGKIGNPNFDPRLFLPVMLAYWRMRAGRLWHRLFG